MACMHILLYMCLCVCVCVCVFLQEETIMESMEVVLFPRHRQFMPKFGLMVAQYDFTRYNLQRIQEDQVKIHHADLRI